MSASRRRAPRGVRLASASLLIILVAVLAVRPARAFVRYKTSTGLGFFWPQTCVPVSAYPLSMANMTGHMDMTSQQIMQAATAAASAWSTATMMGASSSCTFLRVNVTESTGEAPAARLDYKNSLVFRTLSWCPASGDPCYDPSALAITSVFVDTTNGHIQDADIEVNAKNFDWADLVADPTLASSAQDLQNALTHEMGHLIGLDHTCTAGPVTPTPIDNAGQPVPTCDEASAAVRATTMSALAVPGDTGKRTLEADDVAAVCDIYPVAMDPMKCLAADVAPSGGEACRCATGAGAGGPAAAALTGLAVLAAALRRRVKRT
jgi:hypothetical protein